MHSYRCDISDGFHIPDLAEKFILGIYMVRMTGKEGQKIKLFCCKILLHSVYPHPACSGINLKSADFNHLILFYGTSDQPLITCQMCFYPCHQLAWTKRLGHIVISPKSESSDLVDIIFFRRYHDDRCILFRTNLTTNLKAIHARKHQIQNHQIKITEKRLIKPCLSIICNLYFKSTQLQIIFLQICNTLFVFYN